MTGTRQYIVNSRTVLTFQVNDTRNRVVEILSEIPEWVKAPPGTVAMLGRVLADTKPGDTYRVYARIDRHKTITGFEFRPYYGGIWLPDIYDVKLCDVEL